MERHNHRDNFFSILRYHIPVRKKSRSQDGSRGEAPRRNLHPDTWSPRKFATNIRTICKLCLQVSLGCFLKGNHAWWSERSLSFSWRREKILESLNSSRSSFCLNQVHRRDKEKDIIFIINYEKYLIIGQAIIEYQRNLLPCWYTLRDIFGSFLNFPEDVVARTRSVKEFPSISSLI